MYEPFDTLQITGKCISVIGSGGKTTLLRYLSGQLTGTVILTTSTHIYPFEGIPLVTVEEINSPSDREQILQTIRTRLAESRVICLGRPLSSGKLTTPVSAVSFEDLLSAADTVLVEADGSAGRPLKAHRPFEPVIPACTDLTICVAGASGIGKPVSLTCHCPGIFSELAGLSCDQTVTETSLARVLNRENLADLYLLNQVDLLTDSRRAISLCELIQNRASFCSLKEFVSR